jgi:hypothetical protein
MFWVFPFKLAKIKNVWLLMKAYLVTLWFDLTFCKLNGRNDGNAPKMGPKNQNKTKQP